MVSNLNLMRSIWNPVYVCLSHIKEFDIYLLSVFHNSFMGVLAANYKGVK